MKHTIQIIKTNELGDPAVTLYSGEYVERRLPEGGCTSVRITRDDWDDEDSPLRLHTKSKRDLTDEEHKFLFEHAAVTKLWMRHPSAAKYGAPILACGIAEDDFGKVQVAELGFYPAAELEVVTEDTGDDSAESYVLNFSYPVTTGQEDLFRDTL